MFLFPKQLKAKQPPRNSKKNEKNCRINKTQWKAKVTRIKNMLKMQDIFDLLIPFSVTLILNKKFHNCQQCMRSNISNNCIAVITAVVSYPKHLTLLLSKRIFLLLCKQFCLEGMYSHNILSRKVF